jgi:CheY-like chemotaxis protein
MVADKLLRNMKLLPTCVSSGEECIKMMAQETFELVFMDCQMPGMDGFETTQAIRKLEEKFKHKSIPIVALTANTSAEIRQQCLRTGMSDYMAKPIKMGVLYDMLARWI